MAAAELKRRRAPWIGGSLAACALLAAVGLVIADHTSSPPAKSKSPRAAPTVLYATLNGLACPTAVSCEAVGEFLTSDEDGATGDPDGDGRTPRTLVEQRGAAGWRVLPSPNRGKGGAVLSAVSCPGEADCVAVGYYKPAKFPLQATVTPPNYPLIESYDGHAWRIVAGPSVPPNTILEGVSCPTSSACVAVGYSTSGLSSAKPLESPFAESFDGKTWTSMAMPTTPGTTSGLAAVSCAQVANCIAVGSTASSSNSTSTEPLIEVLSDGHWQRGVLPQSVNGPGILYDVACSPDRRCIAVGSTSTPRKSGAALVLSTSSGSIWVTNTAALAQAGDISLTTVACVGDGACVVAGTSGTSLDSVPVKLFAQVGTSTWQALSSPEQSGNVEAVACASTSSCLLVGSVARNAFGNTTTLVAAYADGSWTPETSPVP